jgi:hypothetical protein
MIILKGIIVGVVDKGTTEKPWAIVGIEARSLNRNDLIETKLFECTVFGDNVKNGLHNVYRAQKGVEVYAPINVAFNERFKSVDFQIAGIPLRIEEARPVQATPKVQSA